MVRVCNSSSVSLAVFKTSQPLPRLAILMYRRYPLFLMVMGI
jgi:hypothetical protein